MPDRITHIKRFTDPNNDKAWVDVERIDQLVRTSGQGATFTRTIQNIFWMDEGNDSDNPSRKMHTLTVSNPNGPESVDVLVIDRCTFLVANGLPNIVRKFRNREEDGNDGRKTTSVRIEDDKTTSNYVDVEVVDKFYDHDNDGRVIFQMRNQKLENNANGPGGPPINPPYRLDPYQNIVGVSWGNKDHHNTPFSGYPRYILSANAYINWRPGEWYVTANALTLQILSSTMIINAGWAGIPPGDTIEYTLGYWVNYMAQPGYGTWGFLFDAGLNQGMLDSMLGAAANYDGDGGGGSTGAGGEINWP